jgi:hypothetical protein
VSWERAPVAAALADLLADAAPGVAVFDTQPATLNPPALVVSRPTVVRYSAAAIAVDEVELPVICVGPLTAGDNTVADLAGLVRAAVAAEPTLSGTVKIAWITEERNWRAVTIAGVDCLAVDVIVNIHA